MVLEFLRTGVAAVLVLDRLGPDSPRHATDDGVLGIEAVGEEEGQTGREVIDGEADTVY